MTGEETCRKQAIHTPQIVFEGDTADDGLLRGDRIAGSGFRLGRKGDYRGCESCWWRKVLDGSFNNLGTEWESVTEPRAITAGRTIPTTKIPTFCGSPLTKPRIAATFDGGAWIANQERP
jgi:hypothetical protein